MKKILSTIMLLVVFAGIMNAQEVINGKDSVNVTRPVQVDKNGRVKISEAQSLTFTFTQAQIDSLQKISQFPNGQTYADIRNSWDWARSFTTYADTVKSDSVLVVRSRDTLTIGGTEWARVTVKPFASTDTIYFGIGTVAPTVWNRALPGEKYVSEKLNHTYFTKVFLKGGGAADSIKKYEVTIEAF